MRRFEYDDEAVAIFRAWKPDPDCVATGDRYAARGQGAIAVRCYEAGFLSERQIIDRLIHYLGSTDDPWPAPEDALLTLARVLAWAGVPRRHVQTFLMRMGVEFTCMAADDEEIIAIARGAAREATL